MQEAAIEQTRGRGAPSLYRQEYADLAKRMSETGATRNEITEELGIDNSTFHRWMLAHQEFRDAVKIGRDHADERVVDSLYTRALNGSDTAAIFWLKNRRPKEWRDKIDVEHQHTVTLRALGTDKLLALLEQAASAPQPVTIDQLPAPVNDAD